MKKSEQVLKCYVNYNCYNNKMNEADSKADYELYKACKMRAIEEAGEIVGAGNVFGIFNAFDQYYNTINEIDAE